MSAIPPSFDAKHFRSSLGCFATGVTIVTAIQKDSAIPIGLTASSFNSVSLDPPLVLWSLTNKSANLESFKQANRYMIHVLNAEQLDLAMQFSKGSPAERFHAVDYSLNAFGIPHLNKQYCTAWFECYNRRHYSEGDHTIFIGEVENCEYSDKAPLIFHGGNFNLTPKV